ncbi:hypothetical protein [Halobaculum magnesiiphilum]|uniref:Uncharacterized protein n=1 Tax=Halobaculum magnesiiphilum TaxID=1017351 RepID=A0A8T8WHZ0_9EURY|nr:hypothetical protein [Halobaculum magnesiiphilum]QZP39482.1 hypothetical protein K6T50_18035 [Halobaculum magnesiiphilum]
MTVEEDGSASGGSSMLARTWVIAANYGTPEEYDISPAPEFRAVLTGSGRVELVDDDGALVMAATVASRVRR